MKGKWVSGVALTVLFGGLFAALRSIPASECKFLHYEPVAGAEAGSDELCSVAPVPFVDVTRTRFPVSLEVRMIEAKASGEVRVVFALLDPSGGRIAPQDLAITHTKRIHLMLIDDTMESYRHIHPEAMGPSGLYEFTFRPDTSRYRFFAEFVPRRTRQLAVADGVLEVPGTGAGDAVSDPGVDFELAGLEEPLRRNRDHRLVLRVRSREAGQTLPLEKTMDAYAHLVGFEDSLSGFAHMHPLTVDPEIGETAEMEFVFHPTRPGHFRIWVQVRAHGRDIFRPFDVQVI